MFIHVKMAAMSGENVHPLQQRKKMKNEKSGCFTLTRRRKNKRLQTKKSHCRGEWVGSRKKAFTKNLHKSSYYPAPVLARRSPQGGK